MTKYQHKKYICSPKGKHGFPLFVNVLPFFGNSEFAILPAPTCIFAGIGVY